MHGIAIAILKYGYLDDNTALRRYSASCGPDHDSRMSKKKKWSWQRDYRFAIATNMHGVIFLNIFIVTSNSPVSIYRSICSCSHCFPACYRGPLAAKRTIHGSHTWSGGTIYGNITCRRWSGGPVVAGDQLRRDRTLPGLS